MVNDRRSRGGRHRISVVLAGAALLAGCSVTPSFPDRASGPFRPKLEIGSEAGPRLQIPQTPGPSGPSPDSRPPPGPPQGCTDPDPQVIATIVVVGLVSGSIGALYPGLRAARLDAVEALNYD